MSTTTAPAPADLRGYRAVHTALRDAAHAMARVAPRLTAADPQRLRAFRRYWKGYAGEVHAHHTTEDDVVFPALVERAPEVADLLTTLDADHHHLDHLMREVDAALEAVARGEAPERLSGLLGEVAAHMDTHLGVEDAEILPRIEAHLSRDEYDVLEQQALKEIGFGAQAAFTLPFIEASVTAEERAALLGDAPLPVKLILAVSRARYRTMAARALGDESHVVPG